MKKQDLISIELIDPNPYQPASAEDPAKVREIAESVEQNFNSGIGTNGLLQVPTARKVDGRYQLAFGNHRRLAFALLLSKGNDAFAKMPVIIEDLSDVQMFEAMAVENLQRREISFIEEAETYHTYMTTFNKNSVETAARFQKSEEHIRGRIMLLQLPEAAKAQVKEGKINVTAARSLVSLNKIGGSQLVDKALKEIDSNDHDSPQEAVEHVLNNSQSATWLDKNAGWFSANKNFPRKHLDKLTRDQIMGLLNIPTGLADDTVYWEIKKLLAEYPILHTNLTPENYPKLHEYEGIERLKVVLDPSPCEKCPFHTVMDNRHYCGIVFCRDRKVEAWHKKELEDVSKNLGIPLYQKSEGRAVELDVWNDADKKLFQDGHADLRLAPAQHMWNNFEGVGRELKVVIVGALAEKRLRAQDKAIEQSQAENEKQIRDSRINHLKRQYIDRFGWEVVSHAFAPAFDSLPSVAFLDFLINHIILEGSTYPDFPEGSDDLFELVDQAKKMKKASALGEMRRLAMFVVIYNRIDTFPTGKGDHGDIFHAQTPVLRYAQSCQTVATEWALKLPKDFSKQAEKYQAELDQAIKELKAESKQKVKA